jgi:pseudaminic acid cytidylyltransferase
MKVAILPARGGSKRIPRKNVREFGGRPMLAWPVATALESGLFDRVLVSTDDPAIAEVARAAGAEAPFLRPAGLSGDHAATLPVVQHALSWFEGQGAAVEFACCIYPATPLLRAEDLRAGWERLRESGAPYAVSVTSYDAPVQRAMRVRADGRLQMLQPELALTRSQDLEEACHDAGQFYWGRAEAWREGLPLLSESAAPVRLPRERVQDIDTEEDWRRAEQLFRLLRA